jgi:hypothetical protein
MCLLCVSVRPHRLHYTHVSTSSAPTIWQQHHFKFSSHDWEVICKHRIQKCTNINVHALRKEFGEGKL